MFMTNLPPNYYIVLQIPDTATDEEIRRSYKDLAKLLHPDKNLNDPNATATFQLVHRIITYLL